MTASNASPTSDAPSTPEETVTAPAPSPAPPRKAKPTGLAPNIVFYCKDCQEIGEVTRVGARYVYTCNACGTKNGAFGTVRSIESFFHLEEKRKKRAAMAAKEAKGAK